LTQSSLVAFASVTLLALSFVSTASAQKKSRVVRVEVTIVGHVQRPLAAVDVARVEPRLTLSELRQPLLERIEQSAYREPF
jgi:hypothetical protein